MDKVAELSLRSYTDGDVAERGRFVESLFAGLKEFGFVILKDHPIDLSLLHQAYAMSERVFALSDEAKSGYRSPRGSQRGYTPFGTEHAKTSRFPDLKEFWHVGREVAFDHPRATYYPANIWPAEVPGFRDVFERLYRALDDTGRLMLSALTGPLGVDAGFFDRMTNEGSSTLRLLHYPPIAAGADPNCIRAAAHEDINLITLLVSASGAGLELLTRDGRWLPVDTSPDNIIVDSGDMLARLTNDVLPATTHRVVNPSGPNVSRYSMPYFMHPNPDAVLSCLPSCRGAGPKYPDITGHDFLMERLREIGLTK